MKIRTRVIVPSEQCGASRRHERLDPMPASDFVLLLPPSEGKADGGNPQQPWSFSSGTLGLTLATEREAVSKRLRQLKGGDQKLLGVSGAHLARAQAANSRLLDSPSLPAWQRYTGVVWDHLDLASLTATQRNAFVKRIFVPSGLLGLVRADDLLPDYRLKMGARLAPFGVMAKWWREHITAALLQAIKNKTVIDLLPNEHRAALDWELLPNAIRVDLVAHSGGIVGGHNAKAAKGLLAQHLLLSSGPSIARTVASFKHPQYSAQVAP
ncbi:MAG: peroxide stress protein YaaA [Actinobacteria bacterium]|nr:peroxide stress protein YaaA [Actinomycetota bacterium]MSZ95825.1 peroxide stress protein YaaA [Actinomycetota bacterium]